MAFEPVLSSLRGLSTCMTGGVSFCFVCSEEKRKNIKNGTETKWRVWRREKKAIAGDFQDREVITRFFSFFLWCSFVLRLMLLEQE